MTVDAGASAATLGCSASDCKLDAPILGAILALVRERTGVDFARYRSVAVHRRIHSRMLSLGIERSPDYLEHLRGTKDEAQQLLERLTIKVSRFYRHAPAFDCLRRLVLPELARARPAQPLRIRSVGCGTGEEAWTLAMLLEEAGLPGLVEGTDIDSSALAAAREAVYRAEALEELPQELAARYLEPLTVGRETRHRVREQLRSRVRFSVHDITAPGEAAAMAEPQDLVCCRNLLIYLEPAAQEQVLRALLRMMRPGAYLCLGEAEWPLASIAGSLHALGRNTRVFRLPEALDSRGSC